MVRAEDCNANNMGFTIRLPSIFHPCPYLLGNLRKDIMVFESQLVHSHIEIRIPQNHVMNNKEKKDIKIVFWCCLPFNPQISTGTYP
jgi:hypothetical protein